MKGTRHSEEQIIAMLKQGEAGLTTAELCRAVQPSKTTSATVEHFPLHMATLERDGG